MEGQYFGYDEPAPPWNDSILHRYVFTLYALDIEQCPVEGAFGGDDVLQLHTDDHPVMAWSNHKATMPAASVSSMLREYQATNAANKPAYRCKLSNEMSNEPPDRRKAGRASAASTAAGLPEPVNAQCVVLVNEKIGK
ncbi:MAG: hypothetical protein MAG794_00108 [Gammaproteobacteria bacterium]|nr:hypothetical protein [Gammaproteobacteria bacterium]